jgi:hypothetical protein
VAAGRLDTALHWQTSKVHVARSFQLAAVCPKHCSFEYFHRPDDGGSRHLWNIGLLERDYTALYPSSCDLLSTNLTKIFYFGQLPMSLIFAKWLIHRQTAKCIYNIHFFCFFVSNQPTQTHVCRWTDCPINIKLKPNHKLRPCTVSDILPFKLRCWHRQSIILSTSSIFDPARGFMRTLSSLEIRVSIHHELNYKTTKHRCVGAASSLVSRSQCYFFLGWGFTNRRAKGGG